MSLVSTLALLMTAVAVKPKPKDDRLESLSADFERLRAHRDSLLEENSELRLQIDEMRRLVQQPQWRETALRQGLGAPNPLQGAQAQQQMAYVNRQYNNLQNQHLLGAQNFDPERWCNCVPSRMQVWVARGDGDA
jgi:regulator of replication initiation timing